MERKVYAMFFSGTGTTEKVVTSIGANIASELGCELDIFNFTTPPFTEFQTSDITGSKILSRKQERPFCP